MTARRFPMLMLFCCVLMASTGCSHFLGSKSILSGGATEHLSFPSEREIYSTLLISQGGLQEDYLLAMTTVHGRFSATILTPQGIPVYTFLFRDEDLKVQRHLDMGELLNSLDVLEYVALIFRDTEGLRGTVRYPWQLEQSINGRQFVAVDAAVDATQKITIEYLGEPPWYSTSVLTDTRNGVVFAIHILEVSDVLSE